ncbi:hypothetical protein QNI19_06625 [Cytophagaceae bacterium DM2B3-1]|uniref:Uncharacterized protein n=1 Tax=Xanthocytophaga flava TaxID=3048013 RepID=A0ABT7CFS9_9BACT|nr:hypothetical protein [Xanthocytophaga flavus]MDJ1492599.1 hypothetical protein [Xanthocytophaga flavus]
MLNWQLIKSVNPFAYEQFQEWLIDSYEPHFVSPPKTEDHLTPLLYRFFEKQGIIVNVMGCMWGNVAEYVYEIQQDGNLNGIMGYGYLARADAESAAFAHAFSLLTTSHAA